MLCGVQKIWQAGRANILETLQPQFSYNYPSKQKTFPSAYTGYIPVYAGGNALCITYFFPSL